ncbi:Protein of unknown function [Gryllus bimaculatus]|nr:Protein of unknown function [Gryllus bimaculatus]
MFSKYLRNLEFLQANVDVAKTTEVLYALEKEYYSLLTWGGYKKLRRRKSRWRIVYIVVISSWRK